jgi:WD40 repeat protein
MSRRLVCVVLVVIVLAATLPAQPPATLTITHTLEGHKELVYAVAYAPDGRHLVSGAFDKTVKLWDLSTGKEKKSYAGTSGHQDLVLSTAVSPDGRFFVSGGKDNSIKLWDLPGDGPTRDFPGTPAGLTATAVTPDGTRLATGGEDGAIRLWTTADGKLAATLTGPTKSITGLAITANAKTLAASVADGTVWFWNLADNKLLGTLGVCSGSATAVVFHPNNELVYSAGADGLLKAWSLPAARKPIELPGKPAITLAARTNDGSRWAFVGADKVIRILKTEAAAQDKALPAAPADIACVALASNTVAAGLVDGSVVLWDLAANAIINQHELLKGKKIAAVSVRSDGNEFAAVLEDGSVKVGEVTKDKNKPLDKVISKTLPAAAAVVQYHPFDNNTLATGGADKALKVWKLKEAKAEKTMTADAAVTAVQWTKDGARLLAITGPVVAVGQVADAKVVAKFTHPGPVQSLGLSSDDKRLVTTGDDGKLRLWDLGTQKELQWFSLDKPLTAGFHPDLKRLVHLSAAGLTLEPIAVTKHITAHATPIRALTLMDGGNRAVTAADDGAAKLINLSNGNVDKELKGHAGAILAVAVTPNSQLVFTGGADKTVRAFTPGDGKQVKALTHPAAVNSLAVQGPSNLLIAGCADKSVVVSSIPFTPGQAPAEAFGKVVQTFSHAGPVTGVTTPTAVTSIYTASADKTAKAWRIAGDVPVRNLAGHGNLVDAVAYSPDGLTLASCSHDGTIRFWNPGDGKQTGEVKLPAQPLYCLAWRQDGKQLAVGSFDHSIRLIDVSGKKVEREIKGPEEKSAAAGMKAVYSVAYAPGGQQIYSAGADGLIKLWNAADGALIKTLIDPALKDRAQRDFINQIRLTADGTRLIAVGNAGWLTLWQPVEGKLLHTQKQPTPLFGLALAPDGKSFATGNQNGTIYLIKMP